MTEDTPTEGPEPVRRVAAIDRELLIVEGQRTARTTRIYVDAATGEPLGMRTTYTLMPPMTEWSDDADITALEENP